ncbi:MAG: glycosyltransferase family 4 protein [Acidimicrobiales bacterium]|nr:glycosyltransferase family 4 protein [Acidimicrobiales bacterium]
MIITMVCLTTRSPIGAVTSRFELANALVRRGHDVNVLHYCPLGTTVEHLAWFRFDPGVRHVFPEDVQRDGLPVADFVFASGLPRSCGWPVELVQGVHRFDDEVEARALAAPGPKMCTTRFLVRHVRRAGVPDERIVKVPLGIDHDVFRLVHPIEGRAPQVALLAHAQPRKGMALGLEALAAVRVDHPDLRIVLFGTEQPAEVLPPGAEFFHLPDRQTLVEQVYNGSQVFVCPSLREGFGKPSVEAMACGAALVTFNNGGSEDFAIDGETALVCRRRDVECLARSVDRLLRDDTLRVALAHRGEQFVRRFDWDESARRIERALERCALEPGRFGLT